MGLIATKPEGSSYSPPPAGPSRAVCVQVIDLGTQEETFQDRTLERHKVLIAWEIEEIDPDDEKRRPYLIFQRYTLSLDDRSTMYKHLVAWRGREFTGEELKGFSLRKVLGVPCVLNIVHNKTDKRTYANIGSIMPVMKGTEPLKPVREPFFFDIDEWDDKVFATFGKHLQETILSSPEAKARKTGTPGGNSADDEFDDIPF